MLLVAEPCLGAEEIDALADVVRSGWITMGDRVHVFERTFAEMHGTPDAVAVASCTAGLHLALEALGIGAGDEVLLPFLTFVATANAVVYCGATPVFVDIDSLGNPLMSHADAAAKCTARTKAVIVMHYGGSVADAAIWRDFAQSRGLALIEDSAHAVGPARTGLYGDATVFSFFGNKYLTTGEGGMVVAQDAGTAARVRQTRRHGMTATTMERLKGRALTYDVTMLGYNYRMDELRAAIGLRQLGHPQRWNERRERLSRAYRRMLGDSCPAVLLPFKQQQVSAHHILPIVLPADTDQLRVMEGMRVAGIQTTIHYPPVHHLTWYRARVRAVELPRTEEYGRRELTLPLHPKLDERHVATVVQTLAQVLGQEGRHDTRRR